MSKSFCFNIPKKFDIQLKSQVTVSRILRAYNFMKNISFDIWRASLWLRNRGREVNYHKQIFSVMQLFRSGIIWTYRSAFTKCKRNNYCGSYLTKSMRIFTHSCSLYYWNGYCFLLLKLQLGTNACERLIYLDVQSGP